MRLRSSWVVRSSVVAACASLCVWSLVSAEQKTNPRAEVIRYEAPGGDVYFALKLRAEKLEATATPRDHVVLIDTSASQAGAHRRQGLDVLEGFLKSLPSGDRVSLVAVDVNVTRLTNGFVAPQSDVARQGLAKLKKRVPLGSSQLQPALASAVNSFDEGRGGSILYIGDGMSTGQLMAPKEMRKVLTDLRTRQIPVHSYGVGPRIDLQVLGMLAEQTGGLMLRDNAIDDQKQSASQSGLKLAQAAAAPVLYPESIRVEPAVEQLLPTAVPPIRMDRDTILLGRGPVAANLKVTVKSPTQTLTWTAIRRQDQAGNTYLSALWNGTEAEAGMTLPLAGEEMLNVAREEFETQVEQMVVLGQRALIQKNAPQAEKIAWSIRQADPANVQARVILAAAERVRRGQSGELALAQGEEPKPGATPAPPAAGDKTLDDTPPPGAAAPGTVLPNEELGPQVRERRRIQGELLRNDVNRSIEAALRVMKDNPDASITELERVLNMVKAANDVDSQLRDSLRTRVMSAVNQVKNIKDITEKEKILAAERLSATQARRAMLDRLNEREEKMTQLIDRVRALIFEGFLGNENAFEEAEAVARAAWELDPYNGATVAAIFNAEAAGQLDKAMRLRSLRADKFLATLHQVELSHVPFPDEPPILWPAPEVWKALTERRKKWAAMDLQKYRPTEEKIKRALEAPTSVQFIETPLKDAIKFLQEQHGINIILDEAAMTEDGVNIDTQVNLQLSDIQLRSVLKLMLEPLKTATYLIEDEVLKITTKTKADLNMPTRVYPVGDLVIPIQSGGMGMGMMGGMSSGMSGVMGNGMGGAGMGGGMMGGGMGMFNVADEPAPKVFNNDAVKSRKKKRE